MADAIEFSLPLARSLDTRIYVRLSITPKAVTLFLTSASGEERGAPPPLGSFVYSLPDRFNPSQPLSTALVAVEPTLDFTTRMAKLVAKKAQRPVYVANSISFASAGLGGTVEEELAAFQAVADLVLPHLPQHVAAAS